MAAICGLFLLTFTTCKKDSDLTCNLNATAPAQGVAIEITYEATATGDGAITSLTYASSTGIITVANPALPWTITTLVPSDASISIVATGKVKNGSLKVSYLGSSGGLDISGNDLCSQSSK